MVICWWPAARSPKTSSSSTTRLVSCLSHLVLCPAKDVASLCGPIVSGALFSKHSAGPSVCRACPVCPERNRRDLAEGPAPCLFSSRAPRLLPRGRAERLGRPRAPLGQARCQPLLKPGAEAAQLAIGDCRADLTHEFQ